MVFTGKKFSSKGRMTKKYGAYKTKYYQKKYGLNKTENKQVEKKIKKAIKKEHVMKYFNSNSITTAVAPQISETSDHNEVSVIAFSSTTEFNNAGSAVKYGPQDYEPLLLARPFKENNADEALNAQALNGQYCLPKRATTTFSIERVAYGVPFHASNTVPDDSARSLPIYYRILKVGIKAQQGNAIVVNPNLDLFINSFGQPTGIDDNGFTRLDCRMCPVNTKKYTKLMDYTGVIKQNNIITPTAFHNDNSADFTNKVGNSLVHLTFPFKLSQRKNGKLFYETPQQAGTGPTTFTSGGQRELVLMHFWYGNGHDLLGGTNQRKAPTEADLQIKCKSTSSFVDAQ